MDGLSSLCSSGNTIQGNYIGTNAAGTGALANQSGYLLDSGSNNNTIGGTAAGAGNLISRNTAYGVGIDPGEPGTPFWGTRWFRTAALASTWQQRSHGQQRDEELRAAQLRHGLSGVYVCQLNVTGTSLAVAGYVGSAPSQSTFANARVEIFKSDSDGTGYGEGQTYLGYLTADANGNFSGNLMVSGAAFTQITGTATDGSNNTSEFGPNRAVTVTAVDLIAFTAEGREPAYR